MARSLHARGDRDDRGGGERATADQIAALDEERQLARRHAHDVPALAPWRCEATSLQALLEDAQPRAIPDQDLAAVATTVDEQKQVAAKRIAAQPLFDEPEEAVVALAKINRVRVREDPYSTTRSEDHASARSTAIASCAVRPSSR